MVTFQNLSFDFASRWLYQNVDWHIGSGEKIGLIGKNGTGKSTLLRLITGEYQPTEGIISKDKSIKIGFLNQDLLSFSSDEPLFNVVLRAFERQLQLQDEIEVLLQKMETEYSDDLLNDLSEKQHEFELKGGYEMEARAHETLAGLGFKENERFNPYNTFSGGWRMRAMLAQILLSDPDLLLLDEPTNHLDLPSIEWLESYIQRFSGSFIIVSHDRYFLDRMVTQIVEVAHQKLHYYTGNYSKFLVEKEERMQIHRGAYENQQKIIAEKERNIDRFKAKANKASQAQSWIKMLDKLERIPPPEDDEKGLSFSFKVSHQPGVDVVMLENITKVYEQKSILKNTSATVRRGDKIGLIGPNGVGKSTVLRIIADAESYEGKRTNGYNVQACFFAQHQLEALNMNYSIWEEMLAHAPDKQDSIIRTILGCFLFSGDTVDKKIKVLSGGEKSRVALAKSLLTNSNFLLLDEPTNHLDMQSIEILIDALKRYEGTFVVVSHDRYFLGEVANKIWYIENQQIKEYPGTFKEYEVWAQQRLMAQRSEEQASKKSVAPLPVKTEKAQPQSQTDNKRINGLKKQLKETEELIEKKEREKKTLEQEMLTPEVSADFGKLSQINQKFKAIETELKKATEQWEELVLEIER